jgi:hypothetical protein
MARNYTAKGGDAAGIGIDSKELQREFQKVVSELEKFGNKLDAKELGKIQRRALFVTRDAMKSNIKDFKGVANSRFTAMVGCMPKSRRDNCKIQSAFVNQKHAIQN